MSSCTKLFWISVALLFAGIWSTETFAKVDFPNSPAAKTLTTQLKPGDEKRERFLGDFALGFAKFSGAGGLPYPGGYYGHFGQGGGFGGGFRHGGPYGIGYSGGFNPYYGQPNYGFGGYAGGGSYGFKHHFHQGYQHHHHHGLGYLGGLGGGYGFY